MFIQYIKRIYYYSIYHKKFNIGDTSLKNYNAQIESKSL